MLDDPYFWISLVLFGWFLTPLVVGSRSVGRTPAVGYACTAFLTIPVFVLPLPFVDQPRFDVPAVKAVGGFVAIASFAVVVRAFFRVRAFTVPSQAEALHTSGLYGVVRHPMMSAGTAAVLGWAAFWGSSVGLAFAVVYGLCGWLSSFPEEERLVEEYGEAYEDYRRRVPRFFPSLMRRRWA